MRAMKLAYKMALAYGCKWLRAQEVGGREKNEDRSKGEERKKYARHRK